MQLKSCLVFVVVCLMFGGLNGQILLKYADSVCNRLNTSDFEKKAIKKYRTVEHKIGFLGLIRKDSIIRTESSLNLGRLSLKVYTNRDLQHDTLILNSNNKMVYHARQECFVRERHAFDTFVTRIYCEYDTLQRLKAASYTIYKRLTVNGKSEWDLMDSFLRIWYYNETGKTDRSVDHYVNRDHVSSICKYNAMGKISSIEYFNGDKDHYEFESMKRFFYYSDSTLKEMMDSNSVRSIQTEYTYKGERIMLSKRTIYEKRRSCVAPMPFIDKFERVIEYDTLGQTVFVYDSKQEVVHHFYNHYEGGKLAWRLIKCKNKHIKEVYLYDDEGRLVGVKQYRRGFKKNEIRYKYDTSGCLSALKYFKNGRLREYISVVYEYL